MSGFRNEIFYQLKGGISQEVVISAFTSGLKSFFSPDLLIQYEGDKLPDQISVYFIPSKKDSDQLYSFILNFEYIEISVGFFSFIDASSDTTLLFSDNNDFVNEINSCFETIALKALWFTDNGYNKLSDVFKDSKFRPHSSFDFTTKK